MKGRSLIIEFAIDQIACDNDQIGIYGFNRFSYAKKTAFIHFFR